MAIAKRRPPPLLTGRDLTLQSLYPEEGQRPTLSETALERVDAGHRQLLAARESGDVYGANTGVGANRGERVQPGDGTSHGLRLLRSHCAGFGPTEPDDVVRAGMLIRLNQILLGGAGVSQAFTLGLFRAVEAEAVPTLHRYGSIGTADLAPLAELALTLIGERPWKTGTVPPATLAETDALPFISSSAFTIAAAAQGTLLVDELLAAAEAVSALSFLALRGSAQAWDPRVHSARPHPCQVDVAERMSHLVAASSPQPPSARLQDPYGLRMVPQVHAPSLNAVNALRGTVEREMNSASENPLVVSNGALHHGQFHLATLGGDLDHVRTTLLPALALSASRLSLLTQPSLTGLTPFLSDGTPASSGLMITEYVVQDALAEARALATPSSGPSVSISLGLEEHASFASQSARHLASMVRHGQVILAVEAVAAVRALRMSPDRLRYCPARTAFDALAPLLSPDLADRTLGHDIAQAISALPHLGVPLRTVA